MRVAKKIFTWAAAKKNLINLVEFSKQSLHLKNYSNSFSLLKKALFHCLKGKNAHLYEQIC